MVMKIKGAIAATELVKKNWTRITNDRNLSRTKGATLSLTYLEYIPLPRVGTNNERVRASPLFSNHICHVITNDITICQDGNGGVHLECSAANFTQCSLVLLQYYRRNTPTFLPFTPPSHMM